MSQPATLPPATLHRSMGLRDVTLMGTACIVGTRWIATAAHTGPGSITLFLLAGLFFLVPMARCIGALSAKRSGAGGQYIWAREDYGDWIGFLSFWLYWVGIACWVPNAAMAYVSIVVYAIDPNLVENRSLIVGAGVMAIWTGVGINLIGVRFGRWNQNAGTVSTWGIAAILFVSAGIFYSRHGSTTVIDLTPVVSLGTLNFWSQVAFALTGLELLGMMGAEIRDPERTIGRAGWLAGLGGVLFYGLATLSMLVLLPPAQIDPLFGIMQAGSIVAERLGLGWIPIALALLSLLGMLGQFGGIISATARLSFAAASDGLLPKIFARVHPHWRTPYVSVLALASFATFLLLVMQLGDTMRAAYQELVSMMVLGSFLPFLFLFASAWKAGLRLAPVCGATVTLLAMLFTLLPGEDISNVLLFEAKLLGGFVALLGLGRWIYLRKRPA